MMFGRGVSGAGRRFLQLFVLFYFGFLIFLAPAQLCAKSGQSSADEMDDLDSMFDDSSDSVGTESTPVTSSGPSLNSPMGNIVFNGSVKASLGYIHKFLPEKEKTPYAAFDATIGFTARPSSVLCLKGDIYAKFPGMEWGLKTLYFDYILLDRVYLTGGRTDTKWGNSFIFDTNILDDAKLATSDSSVLDTDDDDDFSKDFFGIATVPIGNGEIQALAQYYYTDRDQKLDKQFISFAGCIEYPFGLFSLKAFAKNWPKVITNTQKMSPVVGLEFSGDVMDWHLTAWGKLHTRVPDKKILYSSYTWKKDDFDYAKFVGGVSRLWQFGKDPQKIGFVSEFETVFDNMDKTNDAVVTKSVAFTGSWRHIAGGIVSANVQWYHNIDNSFGSVIPSLSFSGLPHGTVSFLVPVFYGDQSTTYNKVDIVSTKKKPTVLAGLVFTLNADF
ncbi:MAG: hypothetical protein IKP51_05985 [Treponema sp.]|nr:hypothetical protein [Treponema sp.]